MYWYKFGFIPFHYFFKLTLLDILFCKFFCGHCYWNNIYCIQVSTLWELWKSYLLYSGYYWSRMFYLLLLGIWYLGSDDSEKLKYVALVVVVVVVNWKVLCYTLHTTVCDKCKTYYQDLKWASLLPCMAFMIVLN